MSAGNKLIICISALSLFFLPAKGQTSITLLGGAGQVVRNHPDFPDVAKPAGVASLRMMWKLSGKEPWHSIYKTPYAGLDLTTGTMGNHAVLGYFTGLMGSLSFEKEFSPRWQRMIKLSLGPSWFSNPYNETDNPENVVIGSRFAFLASAEVGLGYRFTDSWSLNAALTILHASNSHFKLPNVGMNLPALMLGARYTGTKPSEKTVEKPALITSKKLAWNFRLGLGMNESGSSTAPVNGPKYPIYLAGASVSRMVSPVRKISAGIEAWYNKGVYDFIMSQEFYSEKEHKRAMAACVVIGHEYLFGRLGVLVNGGVYVYNPFYRDRLKRNEIDGLKDKLKSIFPARLGVQYHLKNAIYNDRKNVFAGIYIKSNFGQADFLETSLGIVL